MLKDLEMAKILDPIRWNNFFQQQQLMNTNFSSPRHITSPHPQPMHPFYHPKQPFSPLASTTIPKSPITTHFVPVSTQPYSKSYSFKPQNELAKSNANSSGYLKPTSEPGSITFNPSDLIKTPTEMSKRSLQDAKTADSFVKIPPDPRLRTQPPSTPTNRQPRLSEPVGFDQRQVTQNAKMKIIPFQKQQDIRKESHPPPHQEMHFFKKHINTQEQPKDEQHREWLKQSARTKKFHKAVSLQNFQLLKSLGKGKYGQVYLARDKASGFIAALKVIQKAILKEEGIVEQFIREVKIQMFLSHPNIVKLYGCFDDIEHIYIILEVATGGQLYQQLKHHTPLSESKTAPLIRQLCSAVDELHTQKIIHRDIKPENIVMHEGVVKLCDFGWSVHLGDQLRTTFCGTPLYVCPQILKGDSYDEGVDIWSIGIMVYEMLVGENPFKISKEEELIKIVKQQVTIPSYIFVSKEARDFLDKCLQKNPADRVPIKALVHHDFFLKNAEKQKNQKKVSL